MIHSLRRRHRVMVLAVGAVTAVLIVLGLLARRPVPKVPVLDDMPAVSERAAGSGR